MKKTILGISLIAFSAIILTGCSGEKKETFYEGGQLKLVATYNSDKKLDGEYTKYYENGTVEEKSDYSDGKLDGVKTSFYENGKVYKKGTFSNGLKNGLFETFDSKGKNKASCIFKDDKKAKDCKKYNKGVLVSVKNFNSEGKRDGVIEKYKKGKLFSRFNFSNGKLDGKSSWFVIFKDKLTEVRTVNYKNGFRNGKTIFVSPINNKKLLNVDFKDGVVISGEAFMSEKDTTGLKIKDNRDFTNFFRRVGMVSKWNKPSGLK